ncbi:hypothetical protein [uncultured Tateyamaria sp.]|uniref:hypothetical protein n=1 Tax=uncultured Tateyamaria sp. TaxID=455651 RepID=UPI00262046CF|nr:hypothetical protein [uncultured Tateyamaria sp.]
MSDDGLRTTDLDQTQLSDEVLVHHQGNSKVQSTEALGQQLAASGPVSEALAEVEKKVTNGTILKSTFPELLVVAPQADGTGGEVLDDDQGSHNQATGSGYDGALVSNAGRYTWIAAWARWKRIGDTLVGSIDREALGVSLVDNTPDVAKPVSAPQRVELDDKVSASTARVSARPPRIKGSTPAIFSEDGRVLLAETAKGLHGTFAHPGTRRLPFTHGQRPDVIDAGGRDARGDALFAPEIVHQQALGHQQVFVREVTPNFETVLRQITFSQIGDVTGLHMVTPHMIAVTSANDPLYQRGALRWRNATVSDGYLRLGVAIGQSGMAAATDAISASVDVDDTVISDQASMPGRLLMFNGGVMPHQGGHGSPAATTPIDPAQLDSLVDAVAGTNAVTSREDASLAAIETMAGPMGFEGSTWLVANLAHGSQEFEELVETPAQELAVPWQNLQAAVARAKVLAEAMGLELRIDVFMWDQGQSNHPDTVAEYKAHLAQLRVRIDELKAISGQTSDIPLVIAQIGAPVRATGQASGPCLAAGEYVRENPHNAALVPKYWLPVGDYASVHEPPLGHLLFGGKVGNVALDMLHGGYRHLHGVGASRTGRRVTVQMSEAIQLNDHLVTDPGNYGVTYADSTGAVSIASVTAQGDQLIVDLAADPSGASEVLSIGCDNADLYAAADDPGLDADAWGLGRAHGQRSCIMAAALKHFHHATGGLLPDVAEHQRIDVTVD